MKSSPFLAAGLFALGASALPLRAASPPAFCTVKTIDGRWFFVDPEGRPFLSKGVDHVTIAPDFIRETSRSPYKESALAKFGSVEKWREATARRLFELGFNTLGAWSDPELAKIEVDGQRLYHAVNLDFSEAYVAEKGAGAKGAWEAGIFPDTFDPVFQTVCDRVAREICPTFRDDRQLLGWFTDNELRWGPDWRSRTELLTDFLNLPADRPGRRGALNLLQKRYADFASFNRVWATPAKSWEEFEALPQITPPFERRELYFQNQQVERERNDADPRRAAYVGDCEAFAGELAERYFQAATSAVRRVDPHHLIFGSRFAYVPADPVIRAAERHVDVIAFNCYDEDPLPVIRRYEAFNKPVMLGEFSFRGRDSGLPNTKGAGPVVDTQEDRATRFEAFVRSGLQSPILVGYHWFQWSDQPEEGRFDGENSNYGIVNIEDVVYAPLADAMRRVNRDAARWHAGGNPDPTDNR